MYVFWLQRLIPHIIRVACGSYYTPRAQNQSMHAAVQEITNSIYLSKKDVQAAIVISDWTDDQCSASYVDAPCWPRCSLDCNITKSVKSECKA